MYTTEGVDAIATITELRSNTTSLLERVSSSHNGILVQKNNEPQAVLLSWSQYKKVADKVDIQQIIDEGNAS